MLNFYLSNATLQFAQSGPTSLAEIKWVADFYLPTGYDQKRIGRIGAKSQRDQLGKMKTSLLDAEISKLATIELPVKLERYCSYRPQLWTPLTLTAAIFIIDKHSKRDTHLLIFPLPFHFRCSF
ncbi:MAG: hypothetical protein WBX22_15760 [Silvibacterium sp.]